MSPVTYKNNNLILEVNSVVVFLKGRLKKAVKLSKGNGNRPGQFFHSFSTVLIKCPIYAVSRIL